ncbi:MAG TPA: DUF2891 domain-containing protein [Gammaproteobacteria bacterium]|nr:DUF2891 domain-containing protein [Gammaproteobacteria bacterium]
MKVSAGIIAGADQALLERLARMALANLARDYPNHLQHLLDRDEDALPPRELHPVFSGAYDWHSAVHNYWMLVRLLRLFPEGGYAAEARSFIGRRLNPADVAQECHYFDDPRRASFERPYGLAWVLQLAAELREWNTPESRGWNAALAPLEEVARLRFHDWLPKLSYPIRSGEHSQSAFALGLVCDWARAAGDLKILEQARFKGLEFHGFDVDGPLAYEPSGQDFLSPCLAEADLMRRLFSPDIYARWLMKFLPRIPEDGNPGWLMPAVSHHPSDPKLAHLDGLNLSRAWMLEGMAAGLPEDDPRRAALAAAAERHGLAGLAGIREELYEGSHWLPSFAVYLLTRRGLGT